MIWAWVGLVNSLKSLKPFLSSITQFSRAVGWGTTDLSGVRTRSKLKWPVKYRDEGPERCSAYPGPEFSFWPHAGSNCDPYTREQCRLPLSFPGGLNVRICRLFSYKSSAFEVFCNREMWENNSLSSIAPHLIELCPLYHFIYSLSITFVQLAFLLLHF